MALRPAVRRANPTEPIDDSPEGFKEECPIVLVKEYPLPSVSGAADVEDRAFELDAK